MRRAVIAAAAAVALSVPLGAAGSASADSTVRVSGLSFPASTSTYLSYFGCQDLYHADSRAPQVRIDRGGAPAGARSFALLMPGSGTAAGPVHKVASVADTSVAGLYASGGGSGVAYVWYVTSKLGPGQVWAGRADLAAPSGWGYVNAAGASYDWQLLDAATGTEVRDGGTSTIADFTDTNGDGPGYMLSGFGCGGGDFSIDALRYGSSGSVTTYDLEGIQTTASIKRSAGKVKAGQPVTLTGSVVDATGTPVGAAMVLQEKPAGAAKFRNVGGPVPASTDGYVRQVVRPKVTTSYRWYVPTEGYADGGTSRSVTVVVEAVGSDDPSTNPPTNEPTDPATSEPGDGDSGEVEVPPLPTQSASPSPEPTEAPSTEPTEEPTQEPSDEVSDQPTGQPTDEPTEDATPATP